MDPRTVSVRATSRAAGVDPADRRRRVAVVGVSLMGAAAVSTAVFQTVTGTSTSLAMVPDLASVLSGTASFPTPQGPAAAAQPVSAPAITDLGVPPTTAADPTTPQVDLRANRGPLPGPGESVRSAPAASPLAGGIPAVSGSGGGSGGGAPRGGSDDRSTRPSRPGSTTPGSTSPGTPGSTTPGTTTPGTTMPGTTTPGTTTPKPPSTTPPRSTSPSVPASTPPSPPPSEPTQPPGSAPSSSAPASSGAS